MIARRNLRHGYGDTRGGRRLAIFIASGGVLWPCFALITRRSRWRSGCSS